MKTRAYGFHPTLLFLLLAAAGGLTPAAPAQTVNSGSTGADGDLILVEPGQTVIDLADHPDGIYHYRSIFIGTNSSITFIPNAQNRPVIWLVQRDVEIYGSISLNGEEGTQERPGRGGPGGFAGGFGGSWAGRQPFEPPYQPPERGYGPGGGFPVVSGVGTNGVGGAGVYAAAVERRSENDGQPGQPYGNKFIFPLIGGSGGGGAALWFQEFGSSSYIYRKGSGGGGGGAFLVAASGIINFAGSIYANGGGGSAQSQWSGLSGPGSGGAVRLVASKIVSGGTIMALGGYFHGSFNHQAGAGRIRFDTPMLENRGNLYGDFSIGFNPVILLASAMQGAIQIVRIGDFDVGTMPAAGAPDVVLSPSSQVLTPVRVRFRGVPLNTEVRVTARSSTSSEETTAVARNTTGTEAESIAVANLRLPRGAGLIWARATIPVAAGGAALQDLPLSQTGWTTAGERIRAVEVEAAAGGGTRRVLVTESGQRIPVPAE